MEYGSGFSSKKKFNSDWIVLKTRSGSGLVPSNPDWNQWLTAGQPLVSTWLLLFYYSYFQKP
jgi:hypothetical protein